MAGAGSVSWRSGQNSVKRIANKEFWAPQEDLPLLSARIKFQAGDRRLFAVVGCPVKETLCKSIASDKLQLKVTNIWCIIYLYYYYVILLVKR